jgi:hypothetical protein
MSRFVTDAPALVVREFAGLGGIGMVSAGLSEPAWADTIIEGRGYALELLLRALGQRGYHIEAWRPKPAIGDPTFAMAAARIERSGGSSAPAAVTVR